MKICFVCRRWWRYVKIETLLLREFSTYFVTKNNTINFFRDSQNRKSKKKVGFETSIVYFRNTTYCTIGLLQPHLLCLYHLNNMVWFFLYANDILACVCTPHNSLFLVHNSRQSCFAGMCCKTPCELLVSRSHTSR